jgi:hypothetical protein
VRSDVDGAAVEGRRDRLVRRVEDEDLFAAAAGPQAVADAVHALVAGEVRGKLVEPAAARGGASDAGELF